MLTRALFSPPAPSGSPQPAWELRPSRLHANEVCLKFIVKAPSPSPPLQLLHKSPSNFCPTDLRPLESLWLPSHPPPAFSPLELQRRPSRPPSHLHASLSLPPALLAPPNLPRRAKVGGHGLKWGDLERCERATDSLHRGSLSPNPQPQLPSPLSFHYDYFALPLITSASLAQK